MTKKSFFKGAVILGIAGLIVKVFGAFFRIPLANIIGDTGMGILSDSISYLCSAADSVHGRVFRLPSPDLFRNGTAVGNHREAYRVFRLSFQLLLGLGIVTCLILFTGAPYIVQIMKGETEAIYSMRAIAPALLLCR